MSFPLDIDSMESYFVSEAQERSIFYGNNRKETTKKWTIEKTKSGNKSEKKGEGPIKIQRNGYLGNFTIRSVVPNEKQW